MQNISHDYKNVNVLLIADSIQSIIRKQNTTTQFKIWLPKTTFRPLQTDALGRVSTQRIAEIWHHSEPTAYTVIRKLINF